MLPILLFALGAGQTPNNVMLDDLKRFEITNAKLRDRIKLVLEYRQFYDESLIRSDQQCTHERKSGRSERKADDRRNPNRGNGGTPDVRNTQEESRADQIHRTKTECGYGFLSAARDGTNDLQLRLAVLRRLRQILGEEDYYAGKIPPPCPPKYKRAFEKWQADEKAGRKRKPNGVLKDPT